MNLVGVEVMVHGEVQGVGYRWFAIKRARVHGVGGWVRNNTDGSVSVWAEGDHQAVESLIDDLREGPPMAAVRKVDISWKEYSGRYDAFDIKH